MKINGQNRAVRKQSYGEVRDRKIIVCIFTHSIHHIMRQRHIHIVAMLVLLSCLSGAAKNSYIIPQWHEEKSEFRKSYVEKNGVLHDSYKRMNSDTVNVVDVGVEGDYNMLIITNIYNKHNDPFRRYAVYDINEKGKVKRSGSVERPIYGWVWGMKDMQHYNALWMRSCPKDDYVYMSDVVEYCVVSVNGNDTVYHTPWQPYMYDEMTVKENRDNVWIEYQNNTAWIGGGYNYDVPWCVVYNIESYGPFTGLYLGEGSSVSLSDPVIFVEDKVKIDVSGWTGALLQRYYEYEITTPIEGFWELTFDVRKEKDVLMGGDYRLGIVAQDDYYLIIYLGGNEVYPENWTEGAVKGIMRPNKSGLYDVWWWDAEGNIVDNVVAHVYRGNELVFNFIDENSRLYFARGGAPSDNTATERVEIRTSSGSGFAISNDGYIATNYHVVKDSYMIAVGNEHMPLCYNAVVVATDTVNDLAILKIEDENYTPMGEIPYCLDNRIPRKGESLFGLSYPLPDLLGYDLKASSGLVTTINGPEASIYSTSTEIDFGSSGSPIFDERGNVVGVVVGGWAAGVMKVTSNHIIKAPYLHALIEEVEGLELPQENKVEGMSHPDMIEAISPYIYYIIVYSY